MFVTMESSRVGPLSIIFTLIIKRFIIVESMPTTKMEWQNAVLEPSANVLEQCFFMLPFAGKIHRLTVLIGPSPCAMHAIYIIISQMHQVLLRQIVSLELLYLVIKSSTSIVGVAPFMFSILLSSRGVNYPNGNQDLARVSLLDLAEFIQVMFP